LTLKYHLTNFSQKNYTKPTTIDLLQQTMYKKQHFSIFACVAMITQVYLSAAASDVCLTVETVQGLDLDSFISKPWYGTLQRDFAP
jgi:hypothetical protein